MQELKSLKSEKMTRANRLDIIRDFAAGDTLEDGTMLPLDDFSTEGLTKLARYILKLSRDEKAKKDRWDAMTFEVVPKGTHFIGKPAKEG